LLLVLLACLPGYGQPANLDNPVLPGVADAGVFKFNGEYYIGGVFTNGSFYASKDLVHWTGPVHVFSMNNHWTKGPSAGDSQIHANDINYLNGVFHQYWSVNYWGKDQHVVHIGHATSSHALGPYKEPTPESWLTNRIDPELFVDDDGKCYFYWVKFTDGNTIWSSTMKDPWTLSGEPRYLFASLPNTWETLDNRVEEGPWVIKYRDRYYLMYNTNHTSPQWGNYALGVAVADTPLGFNHSNKYPYPVVKSNQIDLEDTFVDLLKYTRPALNQHQYTFDQPGAAWTQAGFEAAGWQSGKPGFGATPIKNSSTRKMGTRWETDAIYVRKTFTLNRKGTKGLLLRLHHDGNTEVYLNGQRIYQQEGHQYLTRSLDAKALALLRDGENVLALRSAKGQAGNYLDVALFDTGGQPADDILYSPGQPNVLRGPNGFEWWLVYFVDKNAEKRSQFINRVHFFDRQLFVDGPTGPNTPGYHPRRPCLLLVMDLPVRMPNSGMGDGGQIPGNGPYRTGRCGKPAAREPLS
jgi:beta-xylosidase